MADNITKHEFGGLWTRVKLAFLDSYLESYSTAMKNMHFTLHYADAFAGTGSHDMRSNEQQSAMVELEQMKGSVRIALERDGFHHYHLNDLSPLHYEALNRIKEERPDLSIHTYKQDANKFIKDFSYSLTRYDRAVLFVDPYACELEWETLNTIAFSKVIDVLFLFPFGNLLRLTPMDKSKMPEAWERKVTLMLGTDEWVDEIYKPMEGPIEQDLFGESIEEKTERVPANRLEAYISRRLNDIFPYTSKPIYLKNSKGSPLFLLYFSMSNDSPKAIGLAKRIVDSIIKRFERRR